MPGLTAEKCPLCNTSIVHAGIMMTVDNRTMCLECWREYTSDPPAKEAKPDAKPAPSYSRANLELKTR